MTARARGDLAAAEAAGQVVVRGTPDDPRGWVLLGSLAHLEGSLARAAALYRRALASAPADPCAHAALAVALVQTGQPITAQAHFAAATGAGLERWSELRVRRQAHALATMPAGASPRAWDACTTPLFEPADPCHMSLGTCTTISGRVAWTVERLAAALRERPRVVALTGAGISAASGL
ncbi:MAG TPA: tetratricopeptide repeat protein, partial [Nannocystis sp.]